MDFSFFNPTFSQTLPFIGIVIFVVIMVLRIARKAFPNLSTSLLSSILAAWMLLHVFIGQLPILRSDLMPPPLLFYMLFTLGTGVLFSMSKWGKQVALNTPIIFLVCLQIFRFPLELILSSLAGNGNVPIEMTYHGLNFDIVAGILAILILVLMRFREVPEWIFWVWNILGLGLLMVIGVVAPLSSPIPIRVFDSGPPLVLAMFAPWNWIVSICVFFAIVGHLISFRLLWSRRGEASDA